MHPIPGVLEIVPLVISLGEKQYVDDETLNIEELLAALRSHKGKSSTACPNVQAWENAFAGHEECFVITMTSNLSGTYNSARVAMEEYQQEHPECRIEIFDTLSTGPEMRLLAERLMAWVKEDLPFAEIVAKGHAYLSTTRLFYTLQTLHNLAENGRVPKLIASAFDVLGMRIIATASREGTIQAVARCRGDHRALEKLMDQIRGAGYHGGRMRITHVANPDGAEKIKSAVLASWPDADVQVFPTTGLCSYYAEQGGLLIGLECE
jgi:DegV family protein with EDD domain